MYWFSFLRPLSPSFFNASRVGDTAVKSWMMIEAEMYGMMFSAKIVILPSAPPENMSNMPRMPPALRENTSCRIAGSMPGIGM